jgi:hypothetical protein
MAVALWVAALTALVTDCAEAIEVRPASRAVAIIRERIVVFMG